MAEGNGKEAKQRKLAEQLRANLQKRKSQARARRQGEADKRPEGLDTANAGAQERDDASGS